MRMIKSLLNWISGGRVWAAIAVYAVVGIVAAASGHAAAAEDLTAAFDRANRFYEQGKYDEAISGYRALVQGGHASAALYFNLGNAYQKSGHPGAAIANYRLAQRLAPRDPDIAANLRFARESAGGANRPGRRWERLANVLSINELALMSAGLVWLWLLLLAAGQFRRQWSVSLRPWRTAAGIIAVAAVAWTLLVGQTRLGASMAVVTAREAVVRYGPFEEAQTSYTVRDGAELTVLERKDNWLQVQDGARRTGWLRANDVEVLPRG